MARPTKPYGLHVAQGTNRARVEKREADKLHLEPGSIGACPDWMSPEAKEEWDRLTGDKDYCRILAPAMRGAMIDYCGLHGQMLRSRRGMVRWLDGKAADGSANTPAPLEKFTQSEGNRLHSLRMQLALYPGSASKVKAPATPATDDAWSKLG